MVVMVERARTRHQTKPACVLAKPKDNCVRARVRKAEGVSEE